MATKTNWTVFIVYSSRSFFNTVRIIQKRRKEMKVLIATKNPGKVEGARRALAHYFNDVEIEGVKVESNVSEQPVGKETYIGAVNRVDNLIKYAKSNNINADLYMSVESGLTEDLGFWAITNIAVIKNNKGEMGVGTSASFPVPKKHVENVIKNTLATVMDELFNETDLRSSTGGVGILTKDVISRIDLNTQAFIMALTPFINRETWLDTNDENELI